MNLNSSALRRELHGVHQEVPDDLLEAARVSRDGRRSRVEHVLQSNGLGLGRGPDRIKGSLDDGPEIDRTNVETHLARDNPRDIEEVVDELHLHLRSPFDRLGGAPDLGVIHPPQHLGLHQQGGERRAKLMRERRQELVLHQVRLFGLRLRPLGLGDVVLQ